MVTLESERAQRETCSLSPVCVFALRCSALVFVFLPMLLPTSLLLPLLLSLLNLARTCIEFLCYLFLLRIFVFFVLDVCVRVFVCLSCRVRLSSQARKLVCRARLCSRRCARVSAAVSAAVSARVSNGIFVRTTFHNFQLEVSK